MKLSNIELKKYLKRLGFIDTEISLYFGLIDLGKTNVTELSRHTGINRTTTHFGIRKLSEKGLLSKTKVGSKTYIIADNPDKLEEILKKKEEAIKSLRNKLPNVIKNLKINTDKKLIEGVNVKYYEGVEAVRRVYRTILKHNKIYSFCNTKQIRKVFPENVSLFKKALKDRHELEMWEILEDNRENKKERNNLHKERYHIKFLPRESSISDIDFMIFEDNVVIIELRKEKPTAIVIQSSTMYQGLKTLHNIVWNML